jgi:hypothetical protein
VRKVARNDEFTRVSTSEIIVARTFAGKKDQVLLVDRTSQMSFGPLNHTKSAKTHNYILKISIYAT